MAENKKSFLLYADIWKTVEQLPDESAGMLFKTILMYVNDLNPNPEDLITRIAFEPIKQQLKRDLLKYDEIKKKRSEAGKRSAEARTKSTSVESVPTKSTVNDTDTATDTDILFKKETKKEFSVVYPFESQNFISQWEVWKAYKHKQHKFNYKAVSSEQAALTQIQKMSNNREKVAIDIIHHTMANGWKGFVVPKPSQNQELNGLDMLKGGMMNG